MYQIIANLLNIPVQNANSTVTYVAAVLVILFTVVIIDLFYRLIRGIVSRNKF